MKRPSNKGLKAKDALKYFNDLREYQNRGEVNEEFEPSLSENKTIYYTGPDSGIMRSKGFRNENQAKRVKKRMDRKDARRSRKKYRGKGGISSEVIIS